MRRKWAVLCLLAAPLLAGCGDLGLVAGGDPLQGVPQAEENLKALALSLADEAEEAFADVLSGTPQEVAPQATRARGLTLVRDGDGLTVLASLKGVEMPSQPSDLPGSPLGLTIKCASEPPRYCGGKVKKVKSALSEDSQEYRMAWYGERGDDGLRRSETVPLVLTVAETPGGVTAKPKWSYNKIGLGGFWADALIQWPGVEVHLRFPLASVPAQALAGSLDPTPFEEALRRAHRNLPKPFEVDGTPMFLLRQDIALAFFPYRNPRLGEASSVEEVLDQPLGIAYVRVAGGGELTPTDAPRLVEIELRREGPDYYLVATDLKDRTSSKRIRVGEVGWCDGCFGQDPPPRYLGIEDRLADEPLLHLQIGGLLLRGVEKKDIQR